MVKMETVATQRTDALCAFCRGTGRNPRNEAGFYCLTCRGAGAVKEGS